MNAPTQRVPLAVWIVTLAVLIFIPLKIIGYGFLPVDDALADSAKAVSGKTWPEVLVLSNDFKIDNHIGWHALLREFYLLTKWSDESIAVFTAVTLLLLLFASGLPWVSRPEAWLISLILVIAVESTNIGRLMLGRPFLISMAMVTTILFLWKKRGQSPPAAGSFILMTVCMTTAILLHGVWYFWALPAVAFFLAQEYRWGVAAAICAAVGSLLAGLLTGHPWLYLSEAWLQAWHVIGLHAAQKTLVTELRPGGGSYYDLALMGGLLVFRRLALPGARPLHKDPTFWLTAIAWLLQYKAARFWGDWGMPAFMVLIAWDVELFLHERLPEYSWERLGVTFGVAAALFLMLTTDVGGRWTMSTDIPYLSQEDPNLAGWLPGPGGIFYKADMEFFYQTFFHNPHADWRYIAGYEPVLMPSNDFVTYQRIIWNDGNPEAYAPWVEKLRPQDRVVVDLRNSPSNYYPNLEWKFAVGTMWIGRLPAPHSTPAPSRK